MSLVLGFVVLALESSSLSGMPSRRCQGRSQPAPVGAAQEPSSLGQPPQGPGNQGYMFGRVSPESYKCQPP